MYQDIKKIVPIFEAKNGFIRKTNKNYVWYIKGTYNNKEIDTLTTIILRGCYFYFKIKGKDDTRMNYIAVHRIVYCFNFGWIPSTSIIHHINHTKIDNSSNNLELILKSEHVKYHNLERRISFTSFEKPKYQICKGCGLQKRISAFRKINNFKYNEYCKICIKNGIDKYGNN